MSSEKIFVALGLTEPESAVISFLLEHDNSTISDIIEGTKQSRGTIYKAIAGLDARGYISKSETKPFIYTLTSHASQDLKNQLDDFYKKISAKVKPIKIVESHVVLKRIMNIFDKNGYAIKDFPIKKLEERIVYSGRRRGYEIIDKIAEGEYSFGIAVIDKKKKIDYQHYPREFVRSYFTAELLRTANFYNCISVFVFLHQDLRNYQKFYQDLTQTQLLPKYGSTQKNYGIEKKEIIVFKTEENLEEKISNQLQEIHQRRIIINSLSRSLKEKINQAQELLLLSQEHARKIDNLLMKRSPFDEMIVGKALDEIGEPIQKIKNRETRNIGIFRRKFSEEEVRINQYLDAIERRVFLPDFSTLEADLAGLDGIIEKFKPIEYELNDCYSTLFRYGVELMESQKTDSKPSINPFVFTEPYEKEGFFVDQETIEKAAISLGKSIVGSLPNFFQIVTGQAGMGKTHAAKYIYSPIMEKARIRVLYIDCPINYDLVSGIFQEMTQDSLYPPNLIAAIRELRKNVPSTTRELLHVIGEITSLCKNQDFRGVLIILDELENALPYIFFAKEEAGYEPPLALKQLHEIISHNSVENLGFLICCRSRIYKMLEDALKVKNIKEFTFEPGNLQPKHIAEMVDHRYKMWSITGGPRFENEALEEVAKLTQGNTRDTIKYCRELFKFATKNKLEVIEKSTLKKIGAVPLFRY